MENKNNICPISYETIVTGQKYSLRGLRSLSPKLTELKAFPYSAIEQREEAKKHAGKLSIQGVQPKLSIKLNLTNASFEIADIGGNYILKPQNELFKELPENEDISMRLAKTVGIEVPLHGLIYCQDGSLSYFIKRFDRIEKKQKLAVEDFAQLSGQSRDTKYNFSMERLIPIIDQFCTFPFLERKKLFERTLFNYLIGNEDMHLKNFSVITRENIVALAPAYDFVNSTIALPLAKEEIALPLNGKKNNLKKSDIIDYYARDRLGINATIINETIARFQNSISAWQSQIEKSFLSVEGKKRYLEIIKTRSEKIL
jgi:serine/threonine-protein kinase HipA